MTIRVDIINTEDDTTIDEIEFENVDVDWLLEQLLEIKRKAR